MHTLCPGCKKNYRFVHPADFELSKSFYQNPNITQLRKEYNFLTKKAIVNQLTKLKIPVKTYSLHYLLYNYRNFSDWDLKDLTDMFEFNRKNIKFLVLYHHKIEDKTSRKFYYSIYENILNEKPIKTIVSETGVNYESLYFVKKFLLDNEITY